MRDLSGRTAFITGGASGIGLAMADAFADKGMRLVIADVNKAGLDQTEKHFKARGTDVLTMLLDVTDRGALEDAARKITAFGKLHVVCANAGIPPSGAKVAETEPEKWDRMMAINLTGVYNTVHYMLGLLRAHGEGGHIVITSSMAGAVAASPIGDYVVAKYAAVGFGEVMAWELKPDNIGVSILMPGTVVSNLSGRPADGPPTGMNASDVGRRVVEAIKANELYVFTHGDYRAHVQARCDALMAAFGDSAQPGFKEPKQVMAMMSQNAYPPKE
ncbi:SDR family NAD(P)-dependent oxidoreductase [Emcibacter sp. SYSU 3D8]|uniref:SDR family NAD(P)-dependent oxidoreductase n=1 Tax=Emcibacter sp. SYSU 3D8 TaxID=3133969 RepID=UPI0031FE9B83